METALLMSKRQKFQENQFFKTLGWDTQQTSSSSQPFDVCPNFFLIFMK